MVAISPVRVVSIMITTPATIDGHHSFPSDLDAGYCIILVSILNQKKTSTLINKVTKIVEKMIITIFNLSTVNA